MSAEPTRVPLAPTPPAPADRAPSPRPSGRHGRRSAAALSVLHVTTGGGNSNGIRMSVAELTAAQAQRQAAVTLHTTGPDTFDDYLHEAGMDAVQHVRSARSGPAAFGFSLDAERWIASPAAAQFNVLHQHGIWPAHAHLTNRWRARHGRPTIVAPHGALQPVALGYSRWKKSLALAAYARRNLDEAACLHATTAEEVAAFRQFGLRNPVAVIPNGTSQEWLRSAGNAARFRAACGIEGAPRTILYLSRIHPTKNLLGLVEAMALLRDRLPEWQLVIAGPVEVRAYHTRVRQAVQQHGLESRVHWVGELHGHAKRDAFAAADLLVLPTLSDNFALVVAEALAVRVPVITTHGALPWSLLAEHRCGWWVPSGAPALAGAIADALSRSTAELGAMGVRGRALVEQRFRCTEIAQRTLQLYEWLLGNAAKPAFVVTD